ncbi:hypothetical protein EDD16DRAFT_574886 [Pisolithus croceorrhizus]|nr:hypothetical protein EV401DRAFT_2208819 [Pisolithus croceorrhizus]KAI6124176.1 hypothetical protein EDD16DRAFT_574886 [Pisolithus croceorrhizus]KAI6159964.1 hypothetical protein EDD17DRAFT_1876288 [Pisolithus thermaeus]
MAIIPLVRTVVFALVTVFSLVVLGISAHLEYLTNGNSNPYLSFAAFGLASACVTAVTLPLFFILGHARRGVFTSMIIFEIVWFLVLWVLWVATAGDTVVDRAYFFPVGCDYSNYPTVNQICYEVTVVEAFAFLNFFIVFFYYDVLILYAIISAIRGRGIWTMSVRDAANSGPHNPAVVMTQPQYPQQLAPQYPQYPGSQKAPSATSCPSIGSQQPYPGNPQQQYPGIPQQQYPGTPQQQYPGVPQPQYPGTPQQQYTGAPQQHYPGMPQQQPYPGVPQQQYPGVPQLDNFNSVQSNYSPNAPSMGNNPLPPQPNYNSYPGSYPPQGQV